MSWMTFVGDKDVGYGFWRVGDSFVMFMTDLRCWGPILYIEK